MQNNIKLIALIISFCLFSSSKTFSQCFEIESILVDACEGATNAEGQNEMVRFKVGNTAINTNQMNVNWPSNSWEGLIQNAATAQKVSLINEEIIAAGGCGTVLEPENGILPANATVIIVTSYLFDITLNPFGAINEDVFILFQNSTQTSGHFGNFGTSALRTLTINFGSCTDTVTYNRSLLVDEEGNPGAANGATVNFTPNGIATYVNNGCTAPVSPIVFEITEYPSIACANTVINLQAEATGFQSITWSSSQGVFSSPNNLVTSFTINDIDVNFITISLTMVNLCGTEVVKTIQIPLQSRIVPFFNNLPTQVCNPEQLPVLPNVSSNGITGTWSPATVQQNYTGSYVFTPNLGECAKKVSHDIAIVQFDFELTGSCNGANYILEVSDLPESASFVWKNEIEEIIGNDSSTFNVTEYFNKYGSIMFSNQFFVEVTVGDCTVSKSIEVESINCSIQKGVSPNGDSKNDFFDLRSLYVLNLKIYNRYGTEVYSKALYRDEWIGQNKKGNLLPTGTYFYEIITSQNKVITGWVQLNY